MLFRVTAVFGAVLMAAVFWFGLQVTVSTWPELMPTLPVTAAVYYVAILISAGHSLLHLVVLWLGGPGIWGGPDGDEVPA